MVRIRLAVDIREPWDVHGHSNSFTLSFGSLSTLKWSTAVIVGLSCEGNPSIKEDNSDLARMSNLLPNCFDSRELSKFWCHPTNTGLLEKRRRRDLANVNLHLPWVHLYRYWSLLQPTAQQSYNNAMAWNHQHLKLLKKTKTKKTTISLLVKLSLSTPVHSCSPPSKIFTSFLVFHYFHGAALPMDEQYSACQGQHSEDCRNWEEL